jgi:hypothetical protein
MPAANNRQCWEEDRESFQCSNQNENLTVECICPKCGTHHKMKMLWTGRGMPKKFCQSCKTFVASIEPVDFCGVPSDIKKGVEKAV